jgi:isoleucyl-tRNA synthetase
MSDITPKPQTINEKELATLAFWEKGRIFEKSVETPAGNAPLGSYSFYDGPPFATGLPHYGHILAGTIKDAVPRYHTMCGKSVRRKWGWDCHGLPIENLIEKELSLKSKKDIEEYGIGKFNALASDSVLRYDQEWKKIVPRLGRWVDMEEAYKTMDATYTESIWWAWKNLYEKGLAYEGNKMMHICPRCETPLAQSEVGLEYHDVTDLSVTAKFELVDEPGTYVLAWTTTPWTLPGNTALALHKDIVYVKIKHTVDFVSSQYILAKSRVSDYFKDESQFEIVVEMQGDALVGKKYTPVFPYFLDKDIEHKENIWKIWHADFITEDSGTGIAHEAPAFGAEDMELAKANNIPVIKHVKMDGTFTADVIDFAGMKVKQKDDTQSADIEIIKWLAHSGKLFEKHKIIHSYPLCWRCKTPLLNYATSSWFVDVPKIKDRLLAENSKIGWVPTHTRDGRFGKWLEGAREWAVSRSRYWGAPLPVWKSEGGDVVVLGSLKELAELSTHKPKNTYTLMRHGEAESNAHNVFETTGDPNNHLTEKGIAQVKEKAEELASRGVDLIIASPFVRAQETARIVSERLGVPIETENRLREYHMGVFDGKDVREYLDYFAHSYLKLDIRPEGGESHRDIMNRSMAAIYDIEKRYAGKHVLIITHGGPIRMMIMGGELKTEEEVMYDEQSEMTQFYLPNAGTYTLNLAMVPRDETGAVNLHRPYIDDVVLEKGGVRYTRIGDVFDCWFESGSMPFASLHYPFENKELFDKNYPADFIAEGVDQTRGWFYSLINLGVGLFDRAPYKHVVVNGLVLAESGVKLSKSEKNYTDPMILVEKYGADAVRYALLSSPVVKGENVQFSDDMVSDVYKKIILRLENVVSLYSLNKPEVVNPASTSLHVLDVWMLGRVHELVVQATKGYESYALDEATRCILDVVDDLSVWYVRRSRDRLKGDTGEVDRMHAYETLAYVLLTLSKVMAPVMPFLAERVYKDVGGEKESVHLESWPVAGEISTVSNNLMTSVRSLVSALLMKRTEAKINVRQPLAQALIHSNLPDAYLEIIKDEVNVKHVRYEEGDPSEVFLDISISEALLQEGDVRNLMRAIQDARKQLGLSPKDVAVLHITYDIHKDYVSNVMNVCNIGSIVAGGGDFKAVISSGEVFFGLSV